jgi:4-hydroxy-3-polyprenylbenzoate decarboxylase
MTKERFSIMLDLDAEARLSRPLSRSPPLDFQAHLAALDAQGLLVRVDRPIDKDAELHPLVRWQFQGGLAEDQRRGFLFTNVVDAAGRRYDVPVAVGALAASPQIYAVGMGRPFSCTCQPWRCRSPGCQTAGSS